MLPAACDRLRLNYFRPFVFRLYLYQRLLHLSNHEHRGARHSSNYICKCAVLFKISSGGSKGGARDAPPSGSDFFYFHAVFGGNLEK